MLRFEDEAATLVEVDPAGRSRAVGMMLGDRKFEGVPEGMGGVRMGNAEEVAEFGEEKLAIGPFRRCGLGPSGDELVDRTGDHAGRDCREPEAGREAEKGECRFTGSLEVALGSCTANFHGRSDALVDL